MNQKINVGNITDHFNKIREREAQNKFVITICKQHNEDLFANRDRSQITMRVNSYYYVSEDA